MLKEREYMGHANGWSRAPRLANSSAASFPDEMNEWGPVVF